MLNVFRAPGCDRTGFDEDVPTCVALCVPGSNPCSGYLNSGDTKRKFMRSSPSSNSDFDEASNNVSIANENAKVVNISSHDALVLKRNFRIITQAELPVYVGNQWTNNLDATFGEVIPLVEYVRVGGRLVETDNTVTVLKKLEDQAFQVGSRGLHGCTMVTVVSRRAVYMV